MDASSLDFAYKYPFSKEAKEIVGSYEAKSVDPRYLELAARQIENATTAGIDYKEIGLKSVKVDYLMAYLYSRMLLSAIKRVDVIKEYAASEARRSGQALAVAGIDEIIKVAGYLGIRLNRSMDRDESRAMLIGFADYIAYAPRNPEFELVNQNLSGGVVLADKSRIAAVLEKAMAGQIAKGLPIKSSELPKQIIEYSRRVKLKKVEIKGIAAQGSRTEAWIEKLLSTPISDVRHRTVNLILAPYLVNTRKLDVEAAVKVIVDYIERCKLVDPDTKVNQRYIEYQCNYAKNKGMRPLSFEKAKELLGNAVEFN